MPQIAYILENVKNGPKLILWVALSIVAAILAHRAHSFFASAKKRSRREKFSNRRYVAGAALVNMERAIAYGDGENFEFFARYAIRTCLGMAESYPPDEPPVGNIATELAMKNIDEETVTNVLRLYSINLQKDCDGTLIEDKAALQRVYGEMRRTVVQLLDVEISKT
jgi:hypothetical protein